MKNYICKINEFCNITPPNFDGVRCRLKIEVVPKEKINQLDKSQYQEVYQIEIICSGTLQGIWGLSNSDLEKRICECGRRYFIEDFSKGTLPKSSTLTLHTRNDRSCSSLNPHKILCTIDYVFEIEVAPKIGL